MVAIIINYFINKFTFVFPYLLADFKFVWLFPMTLLFFVHVRNVLLNMFDDLNEIQNKFMKEELDINLNG